MTEPAHAGGLTVDGAESVPGTTEVVRRLVAEGVPAAIAAKDPTAWGAAAEAEASIRLGWLDSPQGSRALLEPLRALRADLLAEGLDHVVLAGIGIDYDDVVKVLEDEGVEKFAASWNDLLSSVKATLEKGA